MFSRNVTQQNEMYDTSHQRHRSSAVYEESKQQPGQGQGVSLSFMKMNKFIHKNKKQIKIVNDH